MENIEPETDTVFVVEGTPTDLPKDLAKLVRRIQRRAASVGSTLTRFVALRHAAAAAAGSDERWTATEYWFVVPDDAPIPVGHRPASELESYRGWYVGGPVEPDVAQPQFVDREDLLAYMAWDLEDAIEQGMDPERKAARSRRRLLWVRAVRSVADLGTIAARRLGR